MSRPVDESMTLLNEVMDRPLDAGYQEAAARQHPGHASASRLWWLAVVCLALIIGLTLTWGVRALRTPDPGAIKARAVLEADTRRVASEVDRLEDSASRLSNGVEALRLEILAASDPSAAAIARQLATATGALAVGGPGLSVRLSGGQGGASADRIQAGDLRVVVQTLWRSGAEAVAVNGIRLTSLSAIKDVGETVQVQLRPIAEPYIIEAIGSAELMELGLARHAAARIALLRDYLGAAVSIERLDRIELSAALSLTALEYATALPGKEVP